MRRVASVVAALILTASAPFAAQEHGGHPPAKHVVEPEKPIVAPAKPVVVPVKSVVPVRSVVPAAAVPAPRPRPRRVPAAPLARVPRYAVRWPSTDVHWQVQWPAPSDRTTVKWPETAAVTDQTRTD